MVTKKIERSRKIIAMAEIQSPLFDGDYNNLIFVIVDTNSMLVVGIISAFRRLGYEYNQYTHYRCLDRSIQIASTG